jgi:hypothetical protein
MKITLYGMFTTTRHGDSDGSIFTSVDDRRGALEAFVEQCLLDSGEYDENSESVEDMTNDDLFRVCDNKGHEVHFFEDDVEITPVRRPSTRICGDMQWRDPGHSARTWKCRLPVGHEGDHVDTKDPMHPSWRKP